MIETELAYHCCSSRSKIDGTFDFDKGLQRLYNDSQCGLEQLRVGVKRELLLLRGVHCYVSLHDNFDNHTQDKVANAIALKFYCIKKIALECTGDGNCIFNTFPYTCRG
ncbi:hypothetical protein DPMN_074961 [Dreissena polymorpha]|uniref:Uncharacterized protein n=1 Tax=Dreissena polymorpha TaxID=45954 RepID=A0A9D3YJK2_DREPO|nr:hypothetical protein DPMN_074961 [Dreissena polymorpha]